MNKLKTFIWRMIPPGSPTEGLLREAWIKIKLFLLVLAGGLPQFIEKSQQRRYQRWVKRNTPGSAELDKQKNTIFRISPVFGVLLPVGGAVPISRVITTLDSLRSQTYPGWRLSISVDGDIPEDRFRQLSTLVNQDRRINLKRAQASYAAAWNATNFDFVICVKPGDVLSPEMLFELAKEINQNPEPDLIYTDVDQQNDQGVYSKPWFKPSSFSPELLISINFLAHACLKSSLLTQAGGFDPALRQAEEWDVMFRCTELTENVRHIPKILYHQASLLDLSQAWDLCSNAVEQHLWRLGRPSPKARLVNSQILQITWQTDQPLVSIIIPNKDHHATLKRCLDSIFNKTNYSNFEVVIVDNSSQDHNTLAYYEELTKNRPVKVVGFAEPFNYSKAINLGIRHASGDLLLFLNNDVEALDTDWLEEMVCWASLPEIGVVGAKLVYPDRRIQHAGIVIGLYGFVDHIFKQADEHESGIFGSVDWYRNYMAVTGACQMVRRQVFDELGGYDEAFKLVFSDVDFCLRAREKYRVVYTPFARLIHHERSSRGQREPLDDLRLALRRLEPTLKSGDPYYNPNLTCTYWPAPRLDEAGPVEQSERVISRVKLAER